MKELAVRGAGKSFGDLRVLDGVDLAIPAGSFTGILGTSGSGKTTLLRIIAGFERLDEGEVAIGTEVVDDGRRVFVPSEHRRIGYVPQEGALFPHLSVGRNVAFGLRRGPQRRARVLELLDMVGLVGPAPSLSPSALGRPATARRARPGAGDRPRDRAARRTVLLARCELARQRARRGPRRAAPRRHHHHPRDARPGRGAVDGRPGGGAAPRGHRPARLAGGDLPPPARPRPGPVPRRVQRAARAGGGRRVGGSGGMAAATPLGAPGGGGLADRVDGRPGARLDPARAVGHRRCRGVTGARAPWRATSTSATMPWSGCRLEADQLPELVVRVTGGTPLEAGTRVGLPRAGPGGGVAHRSSPTRPGAPAPDRRLPRTGEAASSPADLLRKMFQKQTPP